MPQLSGKGFAHLLLILFTLLLLGGIGVGLYLVQNPAIFKPKASEIPVTTETFRLQNPKPAVEQYLNPFGEAWETKRWANPDIPVVLSSCMDRTIGSWNDRPAEQVTYNRFKPDYGGFGVPQNPFTQYNLDLTPGYINFLKNQNTLWYFNSCVQRASSALKNNMDSLKITMDRLRQTNPNLKVNGYYVFNFMEEEIKYTCVKVIQDGKEVCSYTGGQIDLKPLNDGLAGYLEIDKHEEWFIHDKTKPPSRESRLRYFGERDCTTQNGSLIGRYLFDVTNPGFQNFVANTVADSMIRNSIDILLVDYAAAPEPPKCVTIGDTGVKATGAQVYPDGYAVNYMQSTIQTFSKIKQGLSGTNKLVLFNPYQGNLTSAQDANFRLNSVLASFLPVTDGSYWENPFFYPDKNNPIYTPGLFEFTQKFYQAAAAWNKYLFVQINSGIDDFPYSRFGCGADTYFGCIFSDTSKMLNRQKEEQSLARLYTALHLIFMTSKEKNPLVYITLAKEGYY